MNFQLHQKTILSLLQLPILIFASWFLYMTLGSNIVMLKLGAAAILLISIIQVVVSLLNNNLATNSLSILLTIEIVLFVAFFAYFMIDEASSIKEMFEIGFLALAGLVYLIVLFILSKNTFPNTNKVVQLEDVLLVDED